MHMQKQEIMATRVGEMLDMISCLSIYNGAPPKGQSNLSFLEQMGVR